MHAFGVVCIHELFLLKVVKNYAKEGGGGIKGRRWGGRKEDGQGGGGKEDKI